MNTFQRKRIKMKFEIKNRFSGEVQITADIDCEESAALSVKIGLAVKWAIKHNANLRGADLRGAYLGGADLRGADLGGAYLCGANMRGANLRGADLGGAYLGGADLRGADLRGADLGGADLRGADLGGANLGGANLRGANLRGADLGGANLGGANLRAFKHDLWGILIRYKNEVPELVNYIKQGKIDGSCYSGECSCLMGTFATIKNADIEDNKFSIKDAKSPAEQWFAMIKPGNTPENNFASKMALQWIEEFLSLIESKK
jgi:uncharacterized protein YjbI with pentapeptide repeats